MTITRVLPVVSKTTRNLAVGDVFAEGWGTLTLTVRVVAAIETWFHNGYCNARVTFTDGESHTYYDGSRFTLVEAA